MLVEGRGERVGCQRRERMQVTGRGGVLENLGELCYCLLMARKAMNGKGPASSARGQQQRAWPVCSFLATDLVPLFLMKCPISGMLRPPSLLPLESCSGTFPQGSSPDAEQGPPLHEPSAPLLCGTCCR